MHTFVSGDLTAPSPRGRLSALHPYENKKESLLNELSKWFIHEQRNSNQFTSTQTSQLACFTVPCPAQYWMDACDFQHPVIFSLNTNELQTENFSSLYLKENPKGLTKKHRETPAGPGPSSTVRSAGATPGNCAVGGRGDARLRSLPLATSCPVLTILGPCTIYRHQTNTHYALLYVFLAALVYSVRFLKQNSNREDLGVLVS